MPIVTPSNERIVLNRFIFKAFQANLKLSKISLSTSTIYFSLFKVYLF
ncbi:hypothetical protein C900_01137 [Fulvivirga imtechensis AK7]|uniref:Uncharacterized protein n=1 Tax=Fulvivirga imtechensis AK7 TaxID=1237149 RepID=L8JX60_9BACT|nr:hypothetical protein C900_01137 [Fulvivirga imtechensis AK7]